MKELNINGAVMQCYPLTAAQRLHNYTIKYAPHQVLCIGTGFYVKQDVDFALLKEAIYESYKRFDSMRLRFVQDTDGTIYQYVCPFEEREIPFYDFSSWNEEDAHNEMKKWTAVPFERFNSPMNNVVMIKLPGGFNGVYLKVDHMTMDSSSIIAFDSDVLEIYCAKKYGTPMPKYSPMPYLDAVKKDLEYEAGSPAKQRDTEFWAEELAKKEPMYTDFTGMGRLLTMRRELNKPRLKSCMVVSRDPRADISVYSLEKEPSERLMQFCAENNIPMATLLLMGLRTVLSKFNNDEKDVSIKTCIARRGTLLEKRSGGTRIHFFPLRTIIPPKTKFIDALHIIQGEQNKIFRHANYDPIALTMERGKRYKLTPGASYESMSLTYQPLTIRQRDAELPDVEYKSFWYSNGVAGQPLYLTVMHRTTDNGLNFNFEYRKDVVTESEMEYLYYYLCRVLFRGIEDKDRTVGEILEMI